MKEIKFYLNIYKLVKDTKILTAYKTSIKRKWGLGLGPIPILY